ncbi:MAG: peptidylprolyl isomerase, partial [Polaribacter sp.]
MKKAIYLLLSILIFSACKPDKYKNLDDGLYAEIQTNKGDILLELYPEDVPMTVANFTSLADGTNTRLLDSLKGKNFYEGIIFHRVVNNFVIQGGGFTPEGRKNPGFVFGDEFTKNEDGSLKYKHDDVGVLSMANGGPGSNNSQFFITHRPIPHLDNRHSVFGKTIVSKEQLAILQTANKDTLQLKKAIDSTRMAVVSKIVQGDTIHAVNIIKIGSKANSFDATTIFDRELEKLSVSEKERKAAETKADEARYS